MLPGFRNCRKSVDGLLGHHPDVDGFGLVRCRHGFEAREPEQLIDQMTHPLAFTVDLLEGPLIPLRLPWLRQR